MKTSQIHSAEQAERQKWNNLTDQFLRNIGIEPTMPLSGVRQLPSGPALKCDLTPEREDSYTDDDEDDFNAATSMLFTSKDCLLRLMKILDARNLMPVDLDLKVTNLVTDIQQFLASLEDSKTTVMGPAAWEDDDRLDKDEVMKCSCSSFSIYPSSHSTKCAIFNKEKETKKWISSSCSKQCHASCLSTVCDCPCHDSKTDGLLSPE